MKKRLIVNADDFGIHETVNKAVYRGFESGILTSTSIMAGGRAFDDAVAMANNGGYRDRNSFDSCWRAGNSAASG